MRRILTTGLPGNSLHLLYFLFYFKKMLCDSLLRTSVRLGVVLQIPKPGVSSLLSAQVFSVFVWKIFRKEDLDPLLITNVMVEIIFRRYWNLESSPVVHFLLPVFLSLCSLDYFHLPLLVVSLVLKCFFFFFFCLDKYCMILFIWGTWCSQIQRPKIEWLLAVTGGGEISCLMGTGF